MTLSLLVVLVALAQPCPRVADPENYLTDLCALAYGRAPLSGRPRAEILAEARDLIDAGVYPDEVRRLLQLISAGQPR